MCPVAIPPRSSHRHRAYSPSRRRRLTSEWRRHAAFALRALDVGKETYRVPVRTMAWRHPRRSTLVTLRRPATSHRTSLAEAAAGAFHLTELTQGMVSNLRQVLDPGQQGPSHRSSVPDRQMAEVATGKFRPQRPPVLLPDWAKLAPQIGRNRHRSHCSSVHPATILFSGTVSPVLGAVGKGYDRACRPRVRKHPWLPRGPSVARIAPANRLPAPP